MGRDARRVRLHAALPSGQCPPQAYPKPRGEGCAHCKCRCAAVLYIVRRAPVLLAPFGVVTALLHLLLGILLTILGAGALAVRLLLFTCGPSLTLVAILL